MIQYNRWKLIIKKIFLSKGTYIYTIKNYKKIRSDFSYKDKNFLVRDFSKKIELENPYACMYVICILHDIYLLSVYNAMCIYI